MSLDLPGYYNEDFKLHWDPSVKRNGLGTLIKKVNHIALIVSDIALSLSFYTNVMGFQQIRRPNFDRHGAWLTMGNLELHLIKGNPVVSQGDHLIVGHISVETDHPVEVLQKLKELGVKFAKNVSVPDANGINPITQYFFRDPDGYYIEVCTCDILTNFCLGKDEVGINYAEAVQHVDLSQIFLLSLLADTAKRMAVGKSTPLPETEWAVEADPTKLQNLLTRCKIWGDSMQGETPETISLALRQANNNVPRATRIIKEKKKGNESYIPPAVFKQGETRFQPEAIKMNKKETVSTPIKITPYTQLARELFQKIDKDGNGSITQSELTDLLKSLHQNAPDQLLSKFLHKVDKNNDGKLNFEEFLECLNNQPVTASEEWDSFFKLLDIDGNGKVTAPEICSTLNSLGYSFSDEDIDNIVIEFDEDGNGSLSSSELKDIAERLLKESKVQ